MRRVPDEAAATGVSAQSEMFVLDEAFLRRVDLVMLQLKQADPFQREAAWRATEEEVQMKRPHLQRDDPAWSRPR